VSAWPGKFRQIPLAVDSGGVKSIIEQVLGNTTGDCATCLMPVVDKRGCGEPEARAPRHFLEAARRPHRPWHTICVAYEETDLGMPAIRSAGPEAGCGSRRRDREHGKQSGRSFRRAQV